MVIVGVGLMGAASSWACARAGLSVVTVEQFPLGHVHGSSHGSARIVRRAYADALYARLTGSAFELWRELEVSAGVTLLRLLGGLDHGEPARVRAVIDNLSDAGVPHEVLPVVEAEQRWPGMRFEGDVVFHPQAGTVDAGAAVRAFVREAQGHGAEVRTGTAVRAIRDNGSGALIHLADGSTLAARHVVVAAGGWLPSLLDGRVPLPQLTVSRQDVCHFPRRDLSQLPWPSVIHTGAKGDVYHLAGGRDGGAGDGRKIGEHDRRRPAQPDGDDHAIDPISRARLVEYVQRWLPGLVPEPFAESTCLYTTTPTEDFLLERHGPLVVCSPCSGHGAKFAPLVGEWVRRLITGDGNVPDRFRVAAHAAAAPARVSL